MVIHIALLFFVLILALFNYARHVGFNKKNELFLSLTFICIFLIQGLRSKNVGWDTSKYYDAYYYISIVPVFGFRWEPLFVLLNRFALMISDSPQTIFILSSALINYFTAKFIYDNSKDDISCFWMVFLYITLMPYFNSMNQIRAYLAISIGVHSYSILKTSQRKIDYLRALLVIGVAVGFHRTALILLSIPFVMAMPRVQLKDILFVCALFGVLVIAFDPIVSLAVRAFPVYNKYLNSTYMEGMSASGYHLSVSFIKLLLFVLYFLENGRCKSRDHQSLSHEAVFCLFSILLSILRFKISFAVRMGYYFDLLCFLFLAKSPLKTSKRNARIIYSVLLLFGIVSFFYIIYSPNGSRGTADYTFFWSM